ncbi:MAG: hypothetical protein KF718_16040 [Polyangiaceae bacterium]|nr:hypothetical protein [Polyangiaceae bacterium]
MKGVFGVTILGLALLTGCGGATTEPAQPVTVDDEKAARLLERARQSRDPAQYRKLLDRFAGTSAAEEGKDDLAQLLVADAERALAAGDPDTAEARAEEARLLGGLATTEKARAVQRALDEARAARVAQSAAETKDCAQALRIVAEPLGLKPRPHFRDQLMAAAAEPLLTCLSAAFEHHLQAGEPARARELLHSKDAGVALAKDSKANAERTLAKLAVLHTARDLRPLLAAGKWLDAANKVDELARSEALAKHEVPLARELIQEALVVHLVKLSDAALTDSRAAQTLSRFEQDLIHARFTKDPPEIERARARLRVAAECQRLGCRFDVPKSAWTYGAVDVGSPADATKSRGERVAHGARVWVLGRGRTHALVLMKDPGESRQARLLDEVEGWVDASALRAADTAELLPPTAQLVGVRVWAPLRPPSKDYLLGTVLEVAGKNVKVRRLSDKTEITVPVASIRFGTLATGTRVMAFCTDEVHTEPARIFGVIAAEGGSPRVKIQCDKGDVNRVEVAGALVSKREWLP